MLDRYTLPRCFRLFFAGLALLASSAIPASAQTEDVTKEFWPEFDFFIKLNNKMRICALYTATKQENLNTYSDGQTGVHLDYYALSFRKRMIDYIDPARSRFLMLRVGYLVSRPKNNSGTATEHMATSEATGRAFVPAKWLLSDRNRFDARWLDGKPKQRYRNRLKVERTFDVGRFQLTPYAHAETY